MKIVVDVNASEQWLLDEMFEIHRAWYENKSLTAEQSARVSELQGTLSTWLCMAYEAQQ